MKYVLPILIVICSLSASAQSPKVLCGSEWINIHRDNADLIGVYVEQFPLIEADRPAYEGKHPVLVIFVFKDNRAHQLTYTPTGQVKAGFWWKIPYGDSVLRNMSSDLKPGTVCHE